MSTPAAACCQSAPLGPDNYTREQLDAWLQSARAVQKKLDQEIWAPEKKNNSPIYCKYCDKTKDRYNFYCGVEGCRPCLLKREGKLYVETLDERRHIMELI